MGTAANSETAITSLRFIEGLQEVFGGRASYDGLIAYRNQAGCWNNAAVPMRNSNTQMMLACKAR